MSSITCFGEASGEVQSRYGNGKSTGEDVVSGGKSCL